MTYTAPIDDAARGPVWTVGTLLGPRMKTFHTAAAPASAAWPTANLALLIPFEVGFPFTVAEMFFQAGTTPGTTNYDLGIYDENFGRLASLGSTAAVSTTDAILPVGGGAFAAPITLVAGRYYMAMCSVATTLTTRAWTYGNQFCRALGMQQAALGSVTLPATITPASVGTLAYIPHIGMATINNIL